MPEPKETTLSTLPVASSILFKNPSPELPTNNHPPSIHSPLAPREYSKTLKRLLLYPDGTYEEIEEVDAIELSADSVEDLEKSLDRIVTSSLFLPAVVPYVTAKLMADPQPTFLFDAEQTALFADAAEERVEPVFTSHHAGEIIYKTGDER